MESKGNSTVSSDQKTNEKTFASSATMKPHGKSTAASAIAAKPNGKSDKKTNEKTFASFASMKPHGKFTAASAIAAKPNGKSDVPSDIPKKQKSDVALSSAHGDR